MTKKNTLVPMTTAATYKEAMAVVKKELSKEKVDSLKDCIKAIYRFLGEKEKAYSALGKEILKLKDALEGAEKGDPTGLEDLKVPARFFDEDTLRRYGHTYRDGNSEIRPVDLYEQVR